MRTYMWSEQFAVGESEIDAQHKNLFEAIRELQLEMYGEVQPAVVVEKVLQLQQYSVGHFASEQALFEPYKDLLPMYKDHMAQHASFVEITNSFASRAQIEGEAMVGEMHDFLNKWLIGHIINMDQVTFEALHKLKEKS